MVEPVAGDHLVTSRNYYSHHGLHIGGGKVIHYAGFCNGWQRGRVELTTLNEFEAGRGWTVRSYPQRTFSHSESVARAQGRIGEDHYCVLANNCEHFVSWCIMGDHDSAQVTAGANVLSSATACIGAVGAVIAVGELGVVAGLSGPGIMSGLATIGSVVGGGALAGLGVAAFLPATCSVLLLDKVMLPDNPGLSDNERSARQAGRVGTKIGASVGTVGGLAAIGMTGTVAGFSGAGIASGLAAIGSATGAGAALSTMGIGGGMMMGGVAVTVASPALIAAAAGYGIYRGLRWFKGRSKSGHNHVPLPSYQMMSLSMRITLQPKQPE